MNKKRKVKTEVIKLGRRIIRRSDILAIEDIIRKHMERVNEIRINHYKASGTYVKTREGVRLVDTYVEISSWPHGGRGLELYRDGFGLNIGVQYQSQYDSMTNIPVGLPVWYLKVSGKPGLYLNISPFSTRLIAKRAEAGAEERLSMDRAIRRIKKRYANKRRSLFNAIINF